MKNEGNEKISNILISQYPNILNTNTPNVFAPREGVFLLTLKFFNFTSNYTLNFRGFP